MTTMAMETANPAQVREWDELEGDDWVKYEEYYNRSALYYQQVLEEAARIEPTDSVLDIGCGCGESSRIAARAARSGTVLGVDLSSLMIERARERAAQEGLTNVSFKHVDAQVHRFEPHGFDVAISRFGAMFFGDPREAFRNIHPAMKPAGRLALIAWQGLDRNEWLSAVFGALTAGSPPPPAGSAGPDSFPPFSLADTDKVRRMLTEAGWRDVELVDVNKPVLLGSDAEDAFQFSVTASASFGGCSASGRSRSEQPPWTGSTRCLPPTMVPTACS